MNNIVEVASNTVFRYKISVQRNEVGLTNYNNKLPRNSFALLLLTKARIMKAR